MKFRNNFMAIFSNLANAFSCFRMILDNAFLHLRDCAPCAFILLSSSIVFTLKSLYRRELQAILGNSPTRAEKNIDLGMLLTMQGMRMIKKGKASAYQKVSKRTLHLSLWCLSLRKWHEYQSVQLLIAINGERWLCKHHWIHPHHLRYQDHQ